MTLGHWGYRWHNNHPHILAGKVFNRYGVYKSNFSSCNSCNTRNLDGVSKSPYGMPVCEILTYYIITGSRIKYKILLPAIVHVSGNYPKSVLSLAPLYMGRLI